MIRKAEKQTNKQRDNEKDKEQNGWNRVKLSLCVKCSFITGTRTVVVVMLHTFLFGRIAGLGRFLEGALYK